MAPLQTSYMAHSRLQLWPVAVPSNPFAQRYGTLAQIVTPPSILSQFSHCSRLNNA